MRDDVGPKLARLERQADQAWQRVSASFVRGVTISGHQLKMLSRQHLALATEAIHRFTAGVGPSIAGLGDLSEKNISRFRNTQAMLVKPLKAMAGVAQALAGVRGGAELFQQQAAEIMKSTERLRGFRTLMARAAKETPQQFAQEFVAARTVLGQLPDEMSKMFISAAVKGGRGTMRAVAVAMGRKDIVRAIDKQMVGVSGVMEERILTAFSKSLAKGPVVIQGPVAQMAKATAAMVGLAVTAAGGAVVRGLKGLQEASPGFNAAMMTLGHGFGMVQTGVQRAIGGVGNFGRLMEQQLARIPGAAAVGRFGLGLGRRIISGIGGAIGGIGRVLGGVGKSVMGALGPLLATVGPMRLLSEALAPVFESLKNMLMPLFTPIVTFLLQIVETLRPIVNALMPILQGLMTQLLGVLQPVLASLAGMVATLLTGLAPVLGVLLEAALGVVGPLLQLVTGILEPLLPLITTLVQFALTPLILLLKVLQPVLEFILPWLVKIIDWVLKPITWLLGKLFDNPVVRWIMNLAGGGGAGAAPAPAPPVSQMARAPVPAPAPPLLAAHAMPTLAPETVRGLVRAQVIPVAAPLPVATAMAVAPPEGPGVALRRAVPAEEPEGVLSTLFSPFGPLRLIFRYLLRPMLDEIAAPVRGPLLDIVTGVGDVETAIRAGQPAVPEVDPEFDQGVLYAAGLQEVWI